MPASQCIYNYITCLFNVYNFIQSIDYEINSGFFAEREEKISIILRSTALVEMHMYTYTYVYEKDISKNREEYA